MRRGGHSTVSKPETLRARPYLWLFRSGRDFHRSFQLRRVGHWFEVISPAAPRQTVRAVFPHTAFRLPSSSNFTAVQGGHTGSGCQRLPRGCTA